MSRDDQIELIAVAGKSRGATFRLGVGRTLIGRDKDADIQIDDPFCSRRHVELVRVGEQLVARDLGSRNGTLLNRAPLAESALEPGDEIQIGDVVLLVAAARRRADGIDDDAGTLDRSAGPDGVLVGASQPMREVKAFIERMAVFDQPVLITGESGTGKELVAAAIHRQGPRSAGPLVVTNCACLDGALVDSELFGHTQGAFTGANKARAGCIELAAGGTLFLDEIGELPASTQAKLLRVVEGKPFQRLGGDDAITPRARLIAATHRDLEAMVREGTFRSDLLFRLNVVSLHLPPLRERRADIPLLVDHFLKDLSRQRAVRLEGFSDEALEALRGYAYPGNVRELSHIVARVAILCPRAEAGLPDLPREVRGGGPPQAESPVRRGFPGLRDLERQAVEDALERACGNKSKAARLLGVHRTTLYKLLERYELG